MAEQCGCYSKHDGDIVYCPMHKAAPEMRRALAWTLKHSVGNNHMHSGFCPAGGNSGKACKCGRKALAAARGQPQEARP